MELTLSEDEGRKAVSRALGRTDFVLERLVLKPSSESSTGFMARHLNLLASVTVDGARSDVHMFAKAPPPTAAHRQLVEEMHHFEKELTMYESVVPTMSQAMPDGFRPPVAKCLLTRKASEGRGPEELIVMEDLSKKGYRVWDKMVPFDRAHCLAVVRCLARFHAGALLVQREVMLAGGTNADYVDGTFRVATDWLMADTGGEMEGLWADSSVRTIASGAAGLWPERFGGDGARLVARLKAAWARVAEMVTPSAKHINVVCHGDLWANNMMFRYDEAGGPVDAVLVDLQLVRFAPPATDVLMFFHLSTTRAFRDEHMADLVLEYHRHLEEIVGKAAMDELMPLRTFLDSMEEYALFGKLVSAAWCSITLGNDEGAPAPHAGDPPDFVSEIMRDRGKLVLANARGSESFRQRIMESYEECLRFLGLWK